MYTIKLVNMPFAAETLPSLALTQIRSVLRRELADQVDVEVCYLNLDVARELGPLYHEIEDSMEHLHTGLGDWLFRTSAFPDAADNAEEYFRRCYPRRTPELQVLKDTVLPLRARLDHILDRLLDQYRLHAADLVGFSSIFIQNIACLAMARKIKERSPGTLVVMGGPNCEYPMGGVLVEQAPQIDFAFSGPGLKSFLQFVRHILAGEPDRCHALSGVLSRQNLAAFVPQKDRLVLPGELAASGAFFPSKRVRLVGKDERPESRPEEHHGHPRSLQQVGEELPIDYPIHLDYDDYLDQYEQKLPGGPKPTLLLETSRGCWWGERSHCTFCGLNDLTLGYRSMSVDQAVRHFDNLFRHKDRAQRLMAVDVIIPKPFLTDMLPRLNTPPSMQIFYEAKSSLTEEDVRRLAAARVLTIQPGVEALATTTLKHIKKGSTAFQNIALLKNCAMHGIYPSWNLLLGIPGEQESMYRKYAAIIPLIMHLPPPSDALQIRFDRFSPYFNYAADYGLKLAPMEHYALIYPFDAAKIRDMAYFFRDENFAAEYFVHLAQWFSRMKDAIATWRRRWPVDDASRRAQLFVKREGDELVVHDSRSGEPIEYPISATTWRILREFDKPTNAARVAADLGDVQGLDIDREMAFLTAKGLLFHEDSSAMSLVLPGRAPLRAGEDLRATWNFIDDPAELRTVVSL